MRDGVAGGADQDALLEGLEEGREGALGRLAGDRLEFDGADQAEIAHVDDVRQPLQRCSASSQYGADLGAAGQQALVLVGVERREGRRRRPPGSPNRCSRGRAR